MLEETERRGKDQHKRNADNEVPWADGVMGRKENNNHTPESKEMEVEEKKARLV